MFRPGPLLLHRVQTQHTKQCRRIEAADPQNLERGVRQLLADKLCGTQVGLWLLVPEHLRLGSWDLLCAWSGQPGASAAPRLALQLVHEAALGVTGVRQARALGQRGFALANGLPFLASDQAIHELLDTHSVKQAQELQAALGLIRRARGHFGGKLLAIDPHRVKSYSQRHMRLRPLAAARSRPCRSAQTFFALDAESSQPVCFTTGTAARTAGEATPDLLALSRRILQPGAHTTVVLADSEHFTEALLEDVAREGVFDLLVPMPNQRYFRKQFEALPPEAFRRAWAGLAIAQRPVAGSPLWQLIQRTGEQPAHYRYKGFVCTASRPALESLIEHFPKRWHVEEFFHDHAQLGWQRAGTLNLNIRYGHMSMALVAQAALHQLRQRLGEPYRHWQARHLAQSLLQGLDGDIRVHTDTIVVTFYNAPNAQHLRAHYENLPSKLQAEGINPTIPWLYDLKLDFRFK